MPAMTKEERREYMRLYIKQYRKDHPEYVEQQREFSKKWSAKNPDKKKALEKEYYEKNRKKILAKHREYYILNRSNCLEASKKWRLKNQDKVKEAGKKFGNFKTQLRNTYPDLKEAYNRYMYNYRTLGNKHLKTRASYKIYADLLIEKREASRSQ